MVGVAPGILEATGLRTLAYETALAYTRGITIEQLREGYAKTSTTPMGRSGKLTEVANTVAFLLSDPGKLHPWRDHQHGRRQDQRLKPCRSTRRGIKVTEDCRKTVLRHFWQGHDGNLNWERSP